MGHGINRIIEPLPSGGWSDDWWHVLCALWSSAPMFSPLGSPPFPETITERSSPDPNRRFMWIRSALKGKITKRRSNYGVPRTVCNNNNKDLILGQWEARLLVPGSNAVCQESRSRSSLVLFPWRWSDLRTLETHGDCVCLFLETAVAGSVSGLRHTRQ